MLSMLDKALQAILKMLKKKDERVLLWKNASPTSEMPEQTIAVDWEDYDRLHVLLRHYTSDSYVSECIIPCVSGLHGFLNSSLPVANRFMYLYGRTWDFETNGLKIGKGYMHDTATNAASGYNTQKNSYAIIEAIYGIKSSGGGKLVSLFRKLLVRGGVRHGH